MITRKVKVGNIEIGGGSPIVVQTMCNTHTSDVEATLAQCRRLHEAGAQMIRLTVPGLQDIKPLREIHERLRGEGIDTPLVADIHFSSETAIEAAKVVEKVRINPGNFHRDHHAQAVPIQIGKLWPVIGSLIDYIPPKPADGREHLTALLIIYGCRLLDARLRYSKGIKRKHRPVEYDRIGQVIAFPPRHSIVIDFHIGWHFPFQGIHNALKIIIRKGKTVPIPNALDAVIKKMVNHFSSLNPVLSARHHRQVGMQSVDPLPFIEWSGIRNIQRHRVALPDGGMPVAEHDQ